VEFDSNWQNTFDELGRRAHDWYSAFARQSGRAGFSSLVEPVAPYNRSGILAPVVAVAGAVGIIVLAGVVVAASAVAAAALLAVIFLLTEIFGYDLSLTVPTAPHR
jgi:hypothetical protein